MLELETIYKHEHMHINIQMLIPYAVQTCQAFKYFIQQKISVWDLYTFPPDKVASMAWANFWLHRHPWKRVTICDYSGNDFPLGKEIFD